MIIFYIFNYDYIFKIHTKKSRTWRKQLLDDIAGSPQSVNRVLNDFDTDNTVGMIGTNEWKLPIDIANKPLVDEICKRYDDFSRPP